MRMSYQLNAFFEGKNAEEVIMVFDAMFPRIRAIPYGPIGLSIFYSKDNSDLFLSDHLDESPFFAVGYNRITIHGYDEDYIIKAFTKFHKLKAFL